MPEINTVSASQLLYERGAILKRIYKDKEHIVVEKNEMPIVVMIPVADYQLLIDQQFERSRSQ